jgi:mannose-1-phosphate guanylyltransferase
MFGVIMAGGKGTRFWPLSREALPKQYLKIKGKEFLIQLTIKRLKQLIPIRNILVISNKTQEKEIKKHLPSIPEENFIFEPVSKNTAPCIALAALYLKERDPNGIMAVFPSDHMIENQKKFLSALSLAEEIAKKGDYLITLGIKPKRAETGYGYIHYGKKFVRMKKTNVYSVLNFTEKPSQKKAQRFLKEDSYLWNAGIFVWSINTILRMFEKHLPKIYQSFLPLQNYFNTPEQERAIARSYSKISEISIDYGIMEKADNVLVIPCDFPWSDVGNWNSLKEILPKDKSQNVIIGKHIGVGTKDTIIYSPDKLVATVGLDNLIIVETKDALLVCHKDKAQDIKKITELLSRRGKKRYL